MTGIAVAAAVALATLTPPAHLTSEQDHQRLLDLLHIDALRQGPDGDPNSPRAANFDESKVAPYSSLPDPLRLKSGGRVDTPKLWWPRSGKCTGGSLARRTHHSGRPGGNADHHEGTRGPRGQFLLPAH